jgi:large subunit ribosomal protein L10
LPDFIKLSETAGVVYLIADWQPAETIGAIDFSVQLMSLGKEEYLKKGEKGEVISTFRKKFSEAKSVVFTDYKGLTVAEVSELRDFLRKDGIEFRVVKNTLARIASEGTPVSPAKDLFKGPVAVAIGYHDPVIAPKRVLEYVKKNEKLRLCGGIIEGRLYNLDEVKAVAELPSREVLLSMLIGSFQAPLSKMASAFTATIRTMGYALNALKSKREGQ